MSDALQVVSPVAQLRLNVSNVLSLAAGFKLQAAAAGEDVLHTAPLVCRLEFLVSTVLFPISLAEYYMCDPLPVLYADI